MHILLFKCFGVYFNNGRLQIVYGISNPTVEPNVMLGYVMSKTRRIIEFIVANEHQAVLSHQS